MEKRHVLYLGVFFTTLLIITALVWIFKALPPPSAASAEHIPDTSSRSKPVAEITEKLPGTTQATASNPLSPRRSPLGKGGATSNGSWNAAEIQRFYQQQVGDHANITPPYTLGYLEQHVKPSQAYALLAELSQMEGDPKVLGSMTSNLCNIWAQQDPLAALAYAESLDDKALRAQALEGVFYKLASHHPQEAVEALQTLSTEDLDFEKLFRQNLHGMVEVDPVTTWQTLLTRRGIPSREHIVMAFLGMAYESDPAVAVKFFSEAGADPELAWRITDSFAMKVAEGDKGAAWSWAQALGNPRVRHRALKKVLQRTALEDPQIAAEFHSSLPAGKDYEELATTLGYAWAGKDPVAAQQWASELPLGEGYFNGVRAVSNITSKNDPRGTLNWLFSLPDGAPRQTGINVALDRWSETEPAETLRYMDENLSSHDMTRAISSVVLRLAKVDRQAAFTTASQLRNEEARLEAVKQATWYWASIAPAEAAQQTALLKNEKERAVATEALMREWAGSDQEAATNYLQSLPSGLVRDSGVARFADAITSQDPAGALSWAATISDPKFRYTQMLGIYHSWERQYPEDAKETILKGDYPEFLKHRVTGHGYD